MSEAELIDSGHAAARNTSTQQAISFLGGIYDHFIPAAVGALANRSEFVTSAATPCQPEASQGRCKPFSNFKPWQRGNDFRDGCFQRLYLTIASALGDLFLSTSSAARSGDSSAISFVGLCRPCRGYMRHFDIELVTIPATEDGRLDLDALAARAGTAVVLQTRTSGDDEQAHEVSRIANRGRRPFDRRHGDLFLSGCWFLPASTMQTLPVAKAEHYRSASVKQRRNVGSFPVPQVCAAHAGTLVGLAKDREGRRVCSYAANPRAAYPP